jgi:hypothetical protein
MACGDALATSGIGRRFKENLDQAVSDAGLSRLDWSSGVWQRVRALQDARRSCVHLNISQADLFAPATSATEAIACVRDAIAAIYSHASKPVPNWVGDDGDRARGFHVCATATAHASVIRVGVNPDAPDTIRIAYVHEGKEHVSSYLPAGTDPEPELDVLIGAVTDPISSVRAYRGSALIVERKHQDARRLAQQ